jgi:hypothetical protein
LWCCKDLELDSETLAASPNLQSQFSSQMGFQIYLYLLLVKIFR